MTLNSYLQKRKKTSPEPMQKKSLKRTKSELIFVIQKHDATRLHFDFRLELKGVLKSWAVPKGPSMNPGDKRLAVAVEDHPYEYAFFEGTIPKGNYGAGDVEIWDHGTYSTLEGGTKKEMETSIQKQLEKGELKLLINGTKINGEFVLVKINKSNANNQWLLIKKQDAYADDQAQSPGLIEDVKVSALPASPMPHKIKPMLCHLIEEPFDNEEWIFEIKWDGYRAITEITKKEVSLYSRNFLTFEKQFPEIYHALQTITTPVILDGEIVVLDKEGKSSFQLLQKYLDVGQDGGNLRYILFDILYLDGHDLRSLPLTERKKILHRFFKKIDHPLIQCSDFIQGKGTEVFNHAKKLHLEGIIAKNGQSPYISARSKNWLKIKAILSQEVIICGFTNPRNSRKHFGALIIGVYKNKKLTFVGHTGSGFDTKSLLKIYQLLKPTITELCPFEKKPATNEKPTWVKPQYICEVNFQEWTHDGIMRQPIFQGLRTDKDVKAVTVETPIAESITEEKETPATFKEKITNPTKIYWPESGYTKGDLILYYDSISKYMLPHLKNRPIMLHRFPNGINGEAFFQKNAPHPLPKSVETTTIQHSEKNIDYLLINNPQSLLYVANLGTIDIHAFLSRYQTLNQPDYLVIDLDPEDLPFQAVVEVALFCHEILQSIGINSSCKTTGKRGLHLYIPLHAEYEYEDIETFSKLIAILIHKHIPKQTSIERSPAKRQKLVYLDYLQNGVTKTVVCPYAVRALPGAPVATPLLWKEVKQGLDPKDFTIKTVPSRLAKVGDLFSDLLIRKTNIAAAVKKIEKII